MEKEKVSDPIKVKITANVRVAGKPCKPGAIVEVKGNDKIQLLASGKGVRYDGKEVKSEKA